MKKNIYISVAISILWFSQIASAQLCNVAQSGADGVYADAETVMGQTFTPTCNGSISAFTFNMSGASGNLIARIKTGGTTPCSGTTLFTSATISTVDGVNMVTVNPNLNVTNGTTYFIELSGNSGTNVAPSQVWTNATGNSRLYSTKPGSHTCINTGAYAGNEMQYSITIGDAVMSVELTHFDVTTEGSKTHLTWLTGNEINSHSFDIERSQDGKTFATIGNVKAQGKAANYNFVDNTPLSNTSYYRLKSIDNDQTFAYSKVISIQTKGTKGKLAMYPNPVSNTLNLNYTEGSDFQILNLLGQQVLSGKAAAQVDVSALPQGTYFLKMGAEQVKFVKQ
jgi:hypothetical protein